MATKSSSKLKHLWKSTGKGLTLKQFARDLVAAGDEFAKNWFLNKAGDAIKKQQAERIKNKGGMLQLVRSATKNARRKSKGEKPQTSSSS